MIVKEIKVYDKAKYHYGGQFPPNQTMEQALVHTGMYLGWIIDTGLYSETFAEDQETIRAFKAREITGPQVYKSTTAVSQGACSTTKATRFLNSILISSVEDT